MEYLQHNYGNLLFLYFKCWIHRYTSSKNIEAYLILSFDLFANQIVDSMILIPGFGSTSHQYALRFGIKIITNTLLETAMC